MTYTMKHVSERIIILCLAVLLLSGTAQAETLSIVCDAWAPYQIIDEQKKLSGFSVTLVEAILQELEIEDYTITVYPWKRALTMLKTGDADALFSANFTEERSTFAYYPDEALIETPWVLWVRAEDRLTFESYADLEEKRIGVVRGYSYTPEFWEFLKQNQNYEEVTYDLLNFKKLNHSRVSHIVAELGNGYHIIRELNLKGIIPLTANPIKVDGLYMIFNKANVSSELVEQFSATLKRLKQTALYQDLYSEYFEMP